MSGPLNTATFSPARERRTQAHADRIAQAAPTPCSPRIGAGVKTFGRRVGSALLLLVGLAAGCHAASHLDQVPAADSLARSTVADLRENDLDGVRRNLKDETARYPGFEGEIGKMRAALPEGVPDTLELVASEVLLDGPQATIMLRYVLRNTNGAAQVDVWVEHERSELKVESLRVTALGLR